MRQPERPAKRKKMPQKANAAKKMTPSNVSSMTRIANASGMKKPVARPNATKLSSAESRPRLRKVSVNDATAKQSSTPRPLKMLRSLGKYNARRRRSLTRPKSKNDMKGNKPELLKKQLALNRTASRP